MPGTAHRFGVVIVAEDKDDVGAVAWCMLAALR
jgi:hypothetical protein